MNNDQELTNERDIGVVYIKNTVASLMGILPAILITGVAIHYIVYSWSSLLILVTLWIIGMMGVVPLIFGWTILGLIEKHEKELKGGENNEN